MRYRPLPALCLLLAGFSLIGCASRAPADMADGDDARNDSRPSDTNGSGSSHGGGPGGSLWSELARTALQTGMGFIHH
jgi:hypothetical protein